jgi:hypothetical protein
MVPQSAKSPNLSEPDLAPIRKQVIDAVKVMFSRAVGRNPDAPRIADNKVDLPESGALQDCEFGMILLLVRDWFRGESLESEFFADIQTSEFERVVLALVNRVVDRVLLRQPQFDEGGEGKQTAFFTGEPYTKYKRDPKERTSKFSANLDAAMITIAFLAPAIEQFNEHLVKLDYKRQGIELPSWVQSLRDAALYVILDGLKYALDCRVINNNKFQGFTSDAGSNSERPEDGGLELDHDRLFFTWTACETINDMKSWRESYLDARQSAPPPGPAVTESKALIKELEVTLLQAAEWCESHFFPGLQEFRVPETKELVKEVTQLGGRRSDEKKLQVDQMEIAVQHVYHLSQYAAIRSLAPERVSVEEVRTIVDKLDRLVSTSIMASGLDASLNEELFRTLTRRYSLGSSNPMGYSDDAWYPLVVRSLSGLLSRTLGEIGKRFVRSEVLTLTLTFQRSLENHVINLTDRRAHADESGDEQLWSFAAGQPYVLYATQRTIFALLQYASFLKAVEEFQKVPDDDKREEELSMRLAQRLAQDYFRPVIKQWLSDNPPAPISVSQGKSGLDVPLPEELWAARVVCSWLAWFTKDFNDCQIAANLTQRAHSLQLIKKHAKDTPSPDPAKRRLIDSLKGTFEDICRFGQVGPKLRQLTEWGDEQVVAILFDYLFHEYVHRPINSIEDLLDDKAMELWELIQKAKGTLDSISNLDTKATAP